MKNHLVQSNNPLLGNYSESKVHWYFWDPRALALARQENRPIFLASIKPFCTRCEQLMAEYFEDDEIAEVLNKYYTSILLDSNESPALARLLTTWFRLTQVASEPWIPLMATFSHQFNPWRIYHYQPQPQSRRNLCASLRESAQMVSAQPDLAIVANVLFQRGFSLDQAHGARAPLDTEGLMDATERLLDIFDRGEESAQSGGGQTNYPTMEALLRLTYALYHTPSLSARCLSRVVDTTYSMVTGGLKDHVGGGYFSHSHDRTWSRPVFIKSLADNAQMLTLLLHLYAITRQADSYDEIKKLLQFLLEEMTSGDGAYVHSIHENSSSGSGEKYLYSASEVRQLLPQGYYRIFAQMYGLEPLPDLSTYSHSVGNVVNLVDDEPDSRPILLFARCRVGDLARYYGISFQRCQSILDRCAGVLLQNSKNRRKPVEYEQKILTHSNALMVSALVEAGWLLSDRIYYHYAEMLLAYIEKRLWLDDTVYVGRVNNERVGEYSEGSEIERYLLAPGNLDDYAFLLRAILDCLSSDLSYERLRTAVRLARLIIENFYDSELGEFSYQDKRHYSDLAPLRDIADGDCPGSVPTALECFRRLAWMIGDKEFLEVSSQCSSDYISLAMSDPLRYASMIKNLTQELNPLIILWFIYDENNTTLVHADRIPVFAGRTQYHRVSYANLAEVANHYSYGLYQKLLSLPRQDLLVVVTRKDEILEVIDQQPDIFSLEKQIKRANSVRL